jgi:hypothetical protein
LFGSVRGRGAGSQPVTEGRESAAAGAGRGPRAGDRQATVPTRGPLVTTGREGAQHFA